MKTRRTIVIGVFLLSVISLFVWGPAYETKRTVSRPTAEQRGFLEELRKSAKQDGRVDYLVLGDSVALGEGSEEADQGYGYWLAESLRRERIPVHLENRAVSGQTSGQLLQSLDDRDLRKVIRQSDLISITIGGNDLLRAVLRHKGNLFAALMDFQRIHGRYLNNLKAILARIRQLNPTAPVLITSLYNPVAPDEPYFPLSRQLLRKWNDGMKQAVRGYPAVAVVDVDRRLHPGDRDWLADEIHPNDQGYRSIAEGLMETIRGNMSEFARAR